MAAHFIVGVRKSRSEALTCWGSASGGLRPAGLSPALSSWGTFFRWGFILKILPKRLPFFSSLLFFTFSCWTALSDFSPMPGASTCSSSCFSSCCPSSSSVTRPILFASVARLNKSGPPFFSSVVSAPTAANKKLFLIYIKWKGRQDGRLSEAAHGWSCETKPPSKACVK